MSFLAPLAPAAANAWWQSVFASLSPKAAVLIARDDDGDIVGTVQVQPAWAPNQPHRADICKLIVHRKAQRKGIARSLMLAAEAWAKQNALTLLVLDAKGGGTAEHFYHSTGWTRVGTIPNYALNPDSQALHDNVLFYKRL